MDPAVSICIFFIRKTITNDWFDNTLNHDTQHMSSKEKATAANVEQFEDPIVYVHSVECEIFHNVTHCYSHSNGCAWNFQLK